MKVKSSLSWLVIVLALSVPAAYGAEAPTDSAAVVPVEAPAVDPVSEAPAADAGGLQERVVDEVSPAEENREPNAKKSDIEAVHTEVETLRDQWQQSLSRAYPYTVVQANRPLIISGVGQLRYDHTFNQIANTPDSFTIPFFSLNFAGNLRKDYLEGKNVDYQLGIQTTGTSAISITDAWLSYQIFNSLDSTGPRLSITAGQQKKYFGIEATATEAFLPTIKLAQFAANLGLSTRDLGLVLAGDVLPNVDFGYNYRVPLLQYWLGGINGNGANTSDNNNNKDIFGRIQINAPVNYDHPLRGLSLGVSGYNGWDTKTATNTKTTTATFNTTATPAVPTTLTTATTTASIGQNGKKERYGADLAYVNTPVGFTLEYVHGRDEVATNGTVTNGVVKTPYGFREVNEEAYTFTLFYNFGDQFVTAAKNQDRYDDFYPVTYQPFFRFDRWVPDTSHYGTHSDIYTAGFNWFFAQTTKLQLNYNYKAENGTSPRTNEFLAQFQFGF